MLTSEVMAAEIPFGTPIKTAQTGTFTISKDLVITDARGRTARIVRTDVVTDNGVIHVIDRVLLPAP